MEYSNGFSYKRGKRIGYDIIFGQIILWEVSATDKPRIISEIKKAGYSSDEISVNKVNIYKD